ncbi:putative protein OS=Streptomyces microflavus OX=1919 GN=Smic_07510 PE=4 SV=1 [Streptomyces microflavus]
MPTAILGSHRATGRSITEQFRTFDAHNPHVYRALERMAARRLATSATQIASRTSSRTCAGSSQAPVAGLNNNYTALYARQLIDEHPHWAPAFELRRRRAA